MKIKILKKTYTVNSLKEAQTVWNQIRDEKDFGASTQAGANVMDGKLLVARISYNGRVWLPLPEGEREVHL